MFESLRPLVTCSRRVAERRRATASARWRRVGLALGLVAGCSVGCAGAVRVSKETAEPKVVPSSDATLNHTDAPVSVPRPATDPGLAARHPLAAGVRRIRESMLSTHGAHARLVGLCDGYGHRLSGSRALEEAIDWTVRTLRADGHEQVHKEAVRVPVWRRGAESAAIVEPQVAGAEVPLAVLGLGGTVPTPPGGIEAEVLVVRDEAELAARKAEARGRVVLFDNPMPAWSEARGSGYSHCVRFRVHGARMAAEHGAVGVLVRSVTARSLRSPHTGAMHYGDAEARIPAAAISTEDSDRIARLRAAGRTVRVRLQLGAERLPDQTSYNVVAELRGREKPDEIVIISGHIDSWDVGQGAHDDGSGVVMAMETLGTLRRLGMRPRRTIRLVLWTNEENGMAGARSYVREHAAELPRHVAVIEADSGGFAPVGLGVFLEDKAVEQRVAQALEPLAALLQPLGPVRVRPGRSAPDVSRFHAHGVPAFGLLTHGERYFDYHHTHADTVDKVDPGELQRSAAAMASLAWWLAELPERVDERTTAPPAAP
ncbi:MAG: hypothetical protein RIT45_1174 [Pseudomonadota bacterium]|jgi:Zn-dependent M28 family amino/carboxypeptidase